MSTLAKGKLSVQTGNILPVIKKWLYSQKEIFLRELVSNAFDAITKVKKVSLQEDIFGADDQDYAIDIKIDREKGILSIEDNGVGMTAEEIEKYISQIAFSGAEEFAKKYEQPGEGAGIIGHFGLGFYSAFMVANKVEIQTRSAQANAASAYWVSDGSDEYESGEGTRTKRGTEILLHISDDSKDLLDKREISELVRKYCDFLSVPVKVDGSQVNRKDALWTKQPSQVKKERYTEFYKYLFPFQGDPLFYIHLNVDHPFRLQGILYFPRMEHEMDVGKNGVRIYCRNVFVSDEAQEILPKYLTMLQGVVDLPDLPLNVSRSYVQTDPEIRKISAHITKKVADRLNEELSRSRTEYEKIWSEISSFVKFAMLSDEKFYDQAKNAVLFELATDPGKFCTIDEYISVNKEKAKDKIYYTSDPAAQAGPLKLLKQQEIQVVLLPRMIDTHFISLLESKGIESHFARVDADLADHVIDSSATSAIVDSDAKSLAERLTELFSKSIGGKVQIRVETLRTEDVPALILLPEHMRRAAEMAAAYQNQEAGFPEEHSLIVNLKNPIIQALGKPTIVGSETGASKQERIAKSIYQLARLAQGGFKTTEVEKFTSEIYGLLAHVI